MATNIGAFFVGVGTTSAILAVGFGGGLMMAKTAMEPRTEVQARASQQAAPPVRVILPASSEPAQPPQPTASLTAATEQMAPPPPALTPIKDASAPEQAFEKVDRRKAEAEEREQRNRAAQRKAKRLAERAKRQPQIEQSRPPVMAFGVDEPPHRPSFGFFGND